MDVSVAVATRVSVRQVTTQAPSSEGAVRTVVTATASLPSPLSTPLPQPPPFPPPRFLLQCLWPLACVQASMQPAPRLGPFCRTVCTVRLAHIYLFGSSTISPGFGATDVEIQDSQLCVLAK